MAAGNVQDVNWGIAQNWRQIVVEMHGQIRPIETAIRTSLGKIDKSWRKTGPESDSLNFNLGKLKGRLRYWKSTFAAALATLPASDFKTEASQMVAAVPDPSLPSIARSAILEPDVLRVTFAQFQAGFQLLREAAQTMRQGLAGQPTRTAVEVFAEVDRSPAAQAAEKVTFTDALRTGIPWGMIGLFVVGYFVAKEIIRR